MQPNRRHIPDSMVKEIRELFNYKDGVLFWAVRPSQNTNIGKQAGFKHKGIGRHVITINYNQYLRSHIIWLWHGKNLPIGKDLDHINRNKTDDRIENLRLVNRSTNNFNKNVQKSNLLGMKYISKKVRNGRVGYQVMSPTGVTTSHREYLGQFKTIAEAAKTVYLYLNMYRPELLPTLSYDEQGIQHTRGEV